MRVVYITKKMPYGRDEAFLFAEVEAHLSSGWDIHIVPVQLGPIIHARARGLLGRTTSERLLSLPVLFGAAETLVKAPLRCLSTLTALIKYSGFRLAIRNLAVYPKGLWLARVVRQLGAEHIHAHWIAVPATMAWVASRVSDVPFSITAHRYDIAQGNMIDPKFRHATFVRAIDEGGAAELLQQADVGARSPVLIRMGVEVPVAAVKPPATERLRILVGARLIAKKGHEFLLKAVSLARKSGHEIAVSCYGDGPLKEPLRNLSRELGVEDLITFEQTLSHDLLLGEMGSGRFDVGVLPSITAADGDKEGIPVFLMECMAAGLPVVATKNGGIPELVTDDVGILVEEGGVAGLADALIRLATQPDLRLQLGANARKRIESLYSVRHSAKLLRESILRGGSAN